MARDLLIDIRATDSASPVFVKLGQTATDATNKIDAGAEKAGQELTELQSTVAKMEAAFEKHASESGQAMTDLRTEVKSVADTVQTSTTEMSRSFEAATDRIENAIDGATQATEQAEQSLDNYGSAARDAVAGLAILGTAFAMYAGQARDHEVTVMGLRRVYGEATDSFIALAETMQGTTIFSNDEVLKASSVFGTLKQNYGLTEEAIQSLIVRTADLASVKGVDLVTASQAVQSALRGEAEMAEQLGLTLNQAAIDQEGLTLTMSNTEAAAFRMAAFMDQSAYSVGAAGDVAETTAGKTQQMANKFQDAMMDVVSFTGPVGEAAGALSSFGLEAGIAAGGLAQLGKGLLALRGTAGLGALAASLAGPAGIAVGLGVATVAAWKYFDSLGDNGITGRMNDAATAGENLAQSIARVSHEMASASTGLNLFGDLETLDTAFNDIVRLEELSARWQEVAATGARPTTPITIPGGDFDKASAEWDELIALQQQYGQVAGETLAQVNDAYNEIVTNTLPGHEQALQTAMNIMDDFQAGILTLPEVRDQLNGVIADLPNYAKAALEIEAAQEQLAQAHDNARTAATEQARSEDILTEALIAQEVAAAELLKMQTLRIERQREQAAATLWSGAEPIAEDIVDVGAWAMRWATMSNGIDATSLSAMQLSFEIDATAGEFEKLLPSVEKSTRAVGELDLAAAKMTGTFDDKVVSMKAAEEAYRELAVSIRDSMGAMDPNSILGGTMSGIVGAAQGFASTSQSVADWSGSLMHGNFLMTKMDQLFLDGAISAKTYRDALDANHRIQQSNVSVQEDSLRIQAKQLPLMAQLAEENARYVDSIADMPAEQQLVALGFMDQTKAAQAFSLAQLAASSSTDAMQGSTTEMIAAIAEADPVMKAMLIDMGLISEGADGTISVNFGDVDEGQRALETLNNTVMGFALLISEAFGIEINLDDNDSIARLLSMEEMLRRLDGRSVTAYATVVTTGFNAGALAAAGGASTGTTVTDRYVTGGTHNGGSYAITGEHGPELLWLPNGAQVTNAPASREPISQMRGGGGQSIVYKGPVQQVITVNASALQNRAERLSRSRR